MIVSNVNVPYVLNFYFNNSQIPLVNNHKHLNVTLSNDAKWNCHIESILQNVAKYIFTLRKLKYLLSRDKKNRKKYVWFTFALYLSMHVKFGIIVERLT